MEGKLPCVVKAGTAQRGLGKVGGEGRELKQAKSRLEMRVSTAGDLSDVGSLLSATAEHATLEPFVEAKYDIHVQKIGPHYKAFMRKGISGHWKANQGSSMLEQIAMTERYKLWVDEVSALFGGLDMCSVEGLVGRDGSEVIYEANDSSLALLGETQEEDRRHIAELLLTKMAKALSDGPVANGSLGRRVSGGSDSGTGVGIGNLIKHDTPSYSNTNSPAPHRPPPNANGTGSGQTTPVGPTPAGPPPRGPPPPRPKRQPSLPRDPPPPPPPPVQAASPEAPAIPRQQSEDTMGQLRKTFAGIFGDM